MYLDALNGTKKVMVSFKVISLTISGRIKDGHKIINIRG
jgi:hypothetical protein